MLHEGADNEAGQLARSVGGQLESLRVFLDENGVEPTNNRSERALRFAVLRRKRSNGTQSDKGNRWVERILSLKQTCRMRALPVFPILADAIDAYFKNQTPDLHRFFLLLPFGAFPEEEPIPYFLPRRNGRTF